MKQTIKRFIKSGLVLYDIYHNLNNNIQLACELYVGVNLSLQEILSDLHYADESIMIAYLLSFVFLWLFMTTYVVPTNNVSLHTVRNIFTYLLTYLLTYLRKSVYLFFEVKALTYEILMFHFVSLVILNHLTGSLAQNDLCVLA